MADDAKAVVLAVIDALNRGDLDAFVQLLAPDAVDHSPLPGQGPGPEGWRHKWETLYETFPDISFTIEESVAEGGTVGTRYTMRATRNGRRIEALAMDVIRVRGGKVVEHWGLFDQTALSAELGVR
jgi:predicted ester cyclase